MCLIFLVFWGFLGADRGGRARAVPARRALAFTLSAALASQSRACCTDRIRPLGLQGLEKKRKGLRKNMISYGELKSNRA